MVAVMLTAAEMALDDQPRESDQAFARRMTAQLEQNAADIKARRSTGAFATNPEPEPVKPVKPPSIHNRPRAELSPDDLERVRKSRRERQARWRAKTKFEKTGNAQF